MAHYLFNAFIIEIVAAGNPERSAKFISLMEAVRIIPQNFFLFLEFELVNVFDFVFLSPLYIVCKHLEGQIKVPLSSFNESLKEEIIMYVGIVEIFGQEQLLELGHEGRFRSARRVLCRFLSHHFG